MGNMDFKFDFSSLDMSGGFGSIQEKKEREFVKHAKIKHRPVMYENALAMAKQIDPSENYFAVVSGSFIFGDFIEAMCDVHDLQPEEIIISTLGMNSDNVDSIVNLVDYLGVGHVRLIVSNYFYSMERRPGKLIQYMMQEFKGKPISVAICASHTKLCLMQGTRYGNIVMAGSANLSSSDNLEQFSYTHDDGVFQFCKRICGGILRSWEIYDGATDKSRFEHKGLQGKTLASKVNEWIEEDE